MPTNEYNADRFDLEIYRLMARAEQYATKDKRWAEVVKRIRLVRGPVRAMMNKRDLAETY